MSKRCQVRYVNRDKSHPLYGQAGTIQVRARGPGPRNLLVRLYDGNLVVAPWGNWRIVREETKCWSTRESCLPRVIPRR
ncbi:hypothetical protein MGLY_35500 (plasmid) [Neomoorella glycerini]|uniref:Uncharacterized protein n=1 Tax=Neomoorella glycerini TaxID=55779 RepID=A0A6I5ZWW7_9FIRM|nr:hypothetical protein [Moorella glycerini]QGP94125.1 hypothetical protein MGLY_35500 [Moorella glycerini]